MVYIRGLTYPTKLLRHTIRLHSIFNCTIMQLLIFFFFLPDSEWVYPSVVTSFPVPSPTPVTTSTAMDEKPATQQPESSLIIVPLTVSLLVAIGVTIVLVFTVVALVVYVYCKNRDFAKASRNNLGDAYVESFQLLL